MNTFSVDITASIAHDLAVKYDEIIDAAPKLNGNILEIVSVHVNDMWATVAGSYNDKMDYYYILRFFISVTILFLQIGIIYYYCM